MIAEDDDSPMMRGHGCEVENYNGTELRQFCETHEMMAYTTIVRDGSGATCFRAESKSRLTRP